MSLNLSCRDSSDGNGFASVIGGGMGVSHFQDQEVVITPSLDPSQLILQ